MPELREIKRKRAKVIADARAVYELASKENRSMSPEERASFDAMTAEAETIGAEIALAERLDALERTLQQQSGEQRGGDLLPHNEPRNYGKYSLLRAIITMADRGTLDGIEGEVSQELAKRRLSTTSRKLPSNGFLMPFDLPIAMREARRGRLLYGTPEQRAFDTTSGAGGIPTILDTNYIELLRNRLVVKAAGARVLTDMTGNFAIPRHSASSSMYFVGEGAPITPSAPVTDQVPFAPHTAGCLTDITRRLAEQMNTDAEMFAREDLTATMATGIDYTALNGSGIAPEPRGVMQQPGVPTVPLGTDGAAPTWSQIVGLETSVAVGNADVGKLAYITNPKVRGKLKTTPMVSAPAMPFWLWNGQSPDTPVNGYPCHVTNQVSSSYSKGLGTGLSGMVFGNWDDLLLVFWSGLDVIVDPFTGSASGTLRIVTLQDFDTNIRHTASFAKTVDIVTV